MKGIAMMIHPNTTEVNKRLTRDEARRRAVAARAEVLRIPVDLCRIGIKHLRVNDYLATEARAKECAAYIEMTGDRVGAVLALDGMPWPLVMEGLAERQREASHA
jgi:predicted metal-dependent hydrolase